MSVCVRVALRDGRSCARVTCVGHFAACCGGQMRAFARVRITSGGGSDGGAIAGFAALLAIQPPSTLRHGLCFRPLVSSVTQPALGVLVVACVGAAMAAIVVAWQGWRALRGVCRCDSDCCRSARQQVSASATFPFTSARTSSQLQLVSSYHDADIPDSDGRDWRGRRGGGRGNNGRDSDERRPLVPRGGTAGSDRAIGTDCMSCAASADASRVSVRARLVGAAVNYLLSAYAVITSTVVTVLHCVTVPGAPPGTLWLFVDGSVRCDGSGWQRPVVIAAVLALPLALPLLSSWARPRAAADGTCRTGACNGVSVADGSSLYDSDDDAGRTSPRYARPSPSRVGQDVRWGVHRALSASYVPGMHWWEAVLLVHRLALATVYTFLSSALPDVAVVACVTCNAVALAAHVTWPAFRDGASRHLQTALLTCLVLVAVSGSAASESDRASESTAGVGGVDSDVTTSNSVGRVMDVAFGVVLPLAATAAAYLVPRLPCARASRLV